MPCSSHQTTSSSVFLDEPRLEGGQGPITGPQTIEGGVLVRDGKLKRRRLQCGCMRQIQDQSEAEAQQQPCRLTCGIGSLFMPVPARGRRRPRAVAGCRMMRMMRMMHDENRDSECHHHSVLVLYFVRRYDGRQIPGGTPHSFVKVRSQCDAQPQPQPVVCLFFQVD